jgi:serine/threonine protein kinase
MLAPDTLIHGRYRIIRAIGKGGMGAVYEAFDLRLQSPVALKQMVVEGEQLSRAFAREA